MKLTVGKLRQIIRETIKDEVLQEATTNVLSIRTITDRLEDEESDMFWHYLGDAVTSREAATGIVGASKVKEILGFYMELTAKDLRARGIVFPAGTKFQLER